MGQLVQAISGAATSVGSWLGQQGGGANAGANASGAMGAGAIGTTLGTLSPILQGIMQSNAYGQSAEFARLNAIDASFQGDWNATAAKMRYTNMAERATTGFASENVGLSGRNVKSTVQSIQDIGKMDSDILHYKAARQAWGYLSEAAYDKTAGEQAILGGIAKGASSFLGGAGSLAGKWGAFQQQGLAGGGSTSGFTADAGGAEDSVSEGGGTDWISALGGLG